MMSRKSIEFAGRGGLLGKAALVPYFWVPCFCVPCFWVLCLWATSLSLAAAEPTVKPAVAEGVVFKRDNGRGEPGPAVPHFNPADKTMHFAVKSNEMLKSARVRWVFTAANTAAARGVKVFDEQGLFTGNSLTAELSTEANWPIGRYEGEVFLNDQVWKTFEFEVRPDTPIRDKIDIQGLSLGKDSGTDKPGAVVEGFTQSDRVLHFMAVTKGVRSEVTKVSWTLVAVDTPEGKGLKVAEFELPDVYLNNSTLTSKFSLAKDWPLGKYEISLFLDGEMARKREFKIE